ncbi:MAG: TlpA family protein disulfide reductase [Pyrinomonadaceae bacterium]
MRRFTTHALALCLFATTAHAVVAKRQGTARGARRTTAHGRAKSSGAASTTKTSTAPATPAPTVTAVDLEGLKKLLQPAADPAQARPLLVNFWATWCDPCRAEFPDLVKINEDYRARGLQFVVVSGDDVSEIKTGVPQFLQQMKAPMPAYLLNVPDMEAAINAVDTTWGGDMPATYLYDREGHVVFKHFGRVDPKELRAALDKVLAN